MRKTISWAALLILTGCQTVPPTQTPTEKNQTTDTGKVNTTLANSNAQVTHTTKTTVETESKQYKKVSPQEQSDLWDRISMQFTLPIPDDESIDYYRRWYLKHPKHIETVAQRAQPFLYLITTEIEKRQLPMELVLLPAVESAFDTRAYSSGRAAGLWQFVPSTGTLYGLQQDYWYDGRRDVYASTNAALNYLTYLGDRFDGNWMHAIAAYNSGSGRVINAIRYNQRKGRDTDFFSLRLPRETSSYVPKLMALVDVIAHHEKYGLSLEPIENEPKLALVDPKEQIDLSIAAIYSGLPLKALKAYNPGYNQWATSPDGAQTLLLPLENVDPFEKALAENRGNNIRYVRYKIRGGDSLSVIASRHHSSIPLIKKVNNLKNNQIRAGKYLLIPIPANGNAAAQLAQIISQKQSSPAAKKQVSFSHTVSKGETLWSIAKQHDVSYHQLAKWNNMSVNTPLRVGQGLKIRQTVSAQQRTVTYKVRSGDTLSAIAVKFNIRTTDILKWNNLSEEDYLQPGQKLRLFVGEKTS